MPGLDDFGIAATKLRPPAPPTRLVERTRLDVLLDAGLDRRVPLLLVSAPAGSGKSTLLAGWAARRADASVWVQVDDDDSDPARFWASVVAAIGLVRPQLAARVGPLVVGSGGDGRVVVPAIVNELVEIDEPLTVVIDDYHLVDNPHVHRDVERLIERCPPLVTFVISTRFDPPFRLGRLRVRNSVTEIRAEDLRFARSEAATLLGSAGDSISPDLLDDLCTRTEGWAAGLILAGISLGRAADPAAFVEAFRGDDQLIVGYLSDELLAGMDVDDRRRLLETSVLDRLNGPLVDAVTGSTGGQHWLTTTATQNQLIVRLDNIGEWFRCHHLLRDLLALEAQRTMPERLPELHRRAAAWFESQHEHARAVEHRLAAGDIPGAMRCMIVVGPDLLGTGQIRTLRTLLDQMGPAAETSTVCGLLWGWYHYLTGHYTEAQRWLDAGLAVAPTGFDRVVATPLSINIALGRGDVASALATARDVTDTEQLALRAAELATAVGAAYAWAGLAQPARTALEFAITRSASDGRLTAHVLALVSLAIVEADHGDATTARAAAERAISTAEEYGLPGYHGIAPAFAVRARTTSDPDLVRADVHHAVELARRGTTSLGLAYVLTTCGDLLLELGDHTGEAMLLEAREVIGRCVDPGIAAQHLALATTRHRLDAAPGPGAATLPGPLTERELAVLRYLPTRLTLREISAELYVSTNTVKTHCNAIYRKLGVNDRKNAVQAARDHQLL